MDDFTTLRSVYFLDLTDVTKFDFLLLEKNNDLFFYKM